MNNHRLNFIKEVLSPSEIKGKSVLEVGARDVNGSARQVIEPMEPWHYIGVDIIEGPGVDRICDIHDLVYTFGLENFDVVICTETLEHVDNWRLAIMNLFKVLKVGGTLIITVPAIGMQYHGYPNDYWRFTANDFRSIFGKMRLHIEEDNGVCMKAEKITDYLVYDIHHKVYSILRQDLVENHNKFDYPLRHYRMFQIFFRRVIVAILPRWIKDTLLKRFKR